MRQRDVQEQRLQDFLVPAGLGEHLEAPHHFQAVGQFEHRHAGVRGVLDNEFLVAFGLQAGVLRLDGGNMVEPLHHRANVLVPVFAQDLHPAHPAGLVQVHGGHALGGKTNLVGHNTGHGIRMAYERRPVVTGHIFQGFHSQGPGLLNEGLAFGSILLKRNHWAAFCLSLRAFWKARAFCKCSV